MTLVIPELKEAKVSSLMKIDESAEWEIEILDNLFDPEDKERILTTPISFNYEDDWYWRLYLKGQYTVKSAYRTLVMQSNLHASSNDKHWATHWRMKIPEKMKIHWWRIVKEIIPVRDVLRRRGVDLDISRPLCANHPETIKHLFLECNKTQEIWSACNMDCAKRDPDNLNCVSILSLHDNATLAKISSLS